MICSRIGSKIEQVSTKLRWQARMVMGLVDLVRIRNCLERVDDDDDIRWWWWHHWKKWRIIDDPPPSNQSINPQKAIMLFLPAENRQFRVQHFLEIFPLFRFCFGLIFMLWCIGYVQRTMDKYGVNYVWLLGIDPKCQVGNTGLIMVLGIDPKCYIVFFGGNRSEVSGSLVIGDRFPPLIHICLINFPQPQPNPSNPFPGPWSWFFSLGCRFNDDLDLCFRFLSLHL